MREYADAAAELDALDDVIADSNALLNNFTAWPSAWDRQLAPLPQRSGGRGATAQQTSRAR
ncbi:DUF5129 domain-containing protein [Arthrobacter sp. 4R501]|uniref:DUF5129 domain-containing protein n=1 Tax=Arthrobacter sp. 4R501 TaxID=2058886 RepID=UPI0021581B58|nr:DUF5129 domain-containing protein [Arthrobacter sp. 4R501]